MVTTCIIVINVLVYIVLNMFLLPRGIDLISSFDASWFNIKFNHEYYRLITSLFLHSSINHLINNSFVFFIMGREYEKQEGRLNLLIVYFFGGILASTSSVLYNMLAGNNVGSIGASGAIFSVIGALFIYTFEHRNRVVIPPANILIFALLSLYLGSKNLNTDNIAHLSGLIFGVLIGFVLSINFIKKDVRWS